MKEARDILKKYWGYDSFRPMQEDIVRSAFEGHDTLALLPTGGGKSICFQVPGLMTGKLTLVISPLIALMKDQVENLQSRGLRAASIHSLLKPREIDQLFEAAAKGELDFLYLSPERLGTTLFKERLKRMKLGLIAIDEAHCISQWGHDFRPAYRKISQLRELAPNIPVLALTASATEKVRDDIEEQLSFKNGNRFIGSYRRANLIYSVRLVDDKFGKLVEAIKSTGGSTVVYAGTRKRTVEIAKHLNELGFRSLPYHAGLNADFKSKTQSDWIKGVFPIIVATNAFGMGIDKPDVRLVAHMDTPLEPESYFQEAGRAGRDGNFAHALLICNRREVEALIEKAEERFPDKKIIRKVYRALCNEHQLALGAGKEVELGLDIPKLFKSTEISVLDIYHSLKILELASVLKLSEGVHQASRLFFKCSREALYDFQIRNPKLDPIIKLLLRNYGGLFDVYTRIDEYRLSSALKIHRDDMRRQLESLSKNGLVDFIPANDDPTFTLLEDRIDEKFLRIPPEVYEDRQEIALSRVKFMMEYAVKQQCHSQVLLSYFGELDTPECGKCDVCSAKNSKEQSSDYVLTVLESESQSLEELADSLHIDQYSLIARLRELEDQGMIVREENGKWKLN